VKKIRFLSPRPPSLDAVRPYYLLAETARWYSNGGPCFAAFKDRLEGYVAPGEANAVPLANATLALMLTLRALAPRREPDHVIMPSFTFAAAPSAAVWCGFRPAFADVEPDSWHLDPESLVRALAGLRGEVAAVIAGSTFGTPPPASIRERWEAACADAGVSLIVDSAAGFGSLGETGRPLGLQGDAEIFSFHATKPFAIGEGGLVSTADADLAGRIESLANFGFDPLREISGPVGLNAKLSELAAAVGLAMLDELDDVLATRRALGDEIRERLEPLGYVFQPGIERSTWQFAPALAPSAVARDRFMDVGRMNGIELRAYYEPLHRFSAFEGAWKTPLPVTEALSERAISMPMANDLSEAAVDRIVECAATAVRQPTPARPRPSAR
jgi:dTDP-4-amino-4,6-dideoxygalactose transaminase